MKKIIGYLILVAVLLVGAVLPVSAEEHVLVEEGQRIAAMAEAMVFPTDGSEHSAICPVCGKTVTWTALTAETISAGFTAAKANTHYYLTDSVEAAGVKFTMYNSSTYRSCLHLNGKNLTNTSGVVIEGAAGKLNIMGTGILKGKGSDDYGNAATVRMANVGSVNLYGGTYEKYDSAAATNTIGYGWGGGTISVYVGATVKAGTAGSAVYMDSTMGSAGVTLNIYGGTIDGSATTARTINTEDVADGRENYLTVNVYGGTIKNGKGGNVYVRKNTTFNMYGGTIEGGNASYGGNVYVSGGGVFNLYGGTVTGGVATTNGGNIYITSVDDVGGVMNMYGGTVCGTRDAEGNATGGVAKKGGNISLYTSAILNVTGGTIKDGTATSEGGNICAAPSSSAKASQYATVNLENVTISGGIAIGNSSGGNVSFNRTNATIADGTLITNGYSTEGRGGNLRLYIATVVMTGGVIENGTAGYKNAGMDQLWVQGASGSLSYMYMLGGEIRGHEKEYASVQVDTYGRFYLGGDATIVDNNTSNSDLLAKGKLYICDGWSGSVTAGFDDSWTIGSDAPTADVQVVTLKDDLTTTAGGSFTGRLKHIGTGNVLTGKGDANGTVKVGGVTAVDSEGNKVLVADLLTAWETGDYTYMQLAQNTTVSDLGGKTLCVDLNGYKLTVGGSGTVNAFDTTGDAYKNPTGRVVVTGDAVLARDLEAPNGNRYIAVTESGETTMHRLGIRMSAVTLRHTKAGIYYKAKYECDGVLSGKVDAYGVVVSVKDMPGADFLDEKNENSYTQLETGFASGIVATSGSIFGIMKDDLSADTNTARGEITIYANPYIRFQMDGGMTVVADNKNAGKTKSSEGFTGVGYSLRDVLEMLDGMFYNYNQSNRNTVDGFLSQWKSKGMTWSFGNIGSENAGVDNSALSFGADSDEAYCPVCKKTVTWTAITQQTHGETGIGSASNGKHYYLAEDITYTGTNSEKGFVRAPSTGNTACLHLNGHNLTAANERVFKGYPGTLNVMGNGVVSGNGATGCVLYSQTSGGRINLYGGTYTKPAANTLAMINVNAGGSVHVYEGAWLRGTGKGTVAYLGTGSSADATLGFHGGKVTGGEVGVTSVTTEKNARTVYVDGNAYIEQMFIRDKDVTVSLSGAPVIRELGLTSGTLLSVDTLTEGADITVNTNKVFTLASDTVAHSLKYIHPYLDTDTITLVDNALCYNINYQLYMAPYDYNVSEQAVADGKLHYYFFASNGMIMSPTNAGDIRKWGDTCLVVFPNGQEMLIDTGYAVQAPVLIGSLKKMGVGTSENPLDYLLVTHPHSDHMGGAFSSSSNFFDEIAVGHVYYDDYQYPDNSWVGLVPQRCDPRNITYSSLKKGNVLTFGEGDIAVTMTMLWPKDDVTAEELAAEDAENNHSMVFRFDYGEHSSLFTADIYGDNKASVFDAETELLALYENGELDVDLMKVPHHGLALSSSTLKFLQAVTPEIAVVTGHYEMLDEVVTRYTSTTASKGVGAILLQDRYNGYIHISVGTDGEMTTETER